MGARAKANLLVLLRCRDDRGVVLIIVLGMLVALVLMGTTFVTLQRLEALSSRNYFEATQADLCVQAAVQYSVNFLRHSPLAGLGRPYTGLDADWVPYTDHTAVQTFDILDGKVQAEVKMKITDAAGRLNLNGNIANVESVLQVLLRRLGLPDSAAAGIAAALPLNSLDDLPSLLTNGYDDYKVLRDHVTICGWADGDAVTPGANLQTAARAPVNMNTASYPVLVAVMTPALAETDADTLAQRIIRWRSGENVGAEDYTNGNENPVQTWNEFAAVAASSGLSSAQQQQVALAAFIPDGLHSRILREDNLPDAKGKDELTSGQCATELCFHSGGYYHLDLIVNVRTADGLQTLASRRVQGTAKCHDVWKLATQSDFAGGTLGTNTLTTGDGQVTYETLRTYPEAQWAPAGPTDPSPPSTFVFGGYLALAERGAVRTSDEANNDSVFIVSFNESLDADRTIGGASATHGGTVKGPSTENPLQYHSVIADPLTDSSDLFAEGCRLETPSTDFPDGKKITFPSANFHVLNDGRIDVGTVEMWVKLNFDPQTDTKTHTLFEMKGPPLKVSGVDEDRFITLKIVDDILTLSIQGGWGDWVDNDADVTPAQFDEDDELTNIVVGDVTWNIRSTTAPGPMTQGEWNYIAATWDNNAPIDTTGDGSPDSTGFQAFLHVNGREVGQLEDRANRPVLGGIAEGPVFGPADVFVDEIRYRQEVLADDPATNTARYPQGRYDNRGTLTYISAWRSIGDNVPLGTVAWTEWLPQSSLITGSDLTFQVQIDDNMDGTPDQFSAALGPGTGSGNDGEGHSIDLTSAVGTDGAQARFVATFVPGTPVSTENGLLRQAPILDDVTLTIMSDWEILSWKEVPVSEE